MSFGEAPSQDAGTRCDAVGMFDPEELVHGLDGPPAIDSQAATSTAVVLPRGMPFMPAHDINLVAQFTLIPAQ